MLNIWEKLQLLIRSHVAKAAWVTCFCAACTPARILWNGLPDHTDSRLFPNSPLWPTNPQPFIKLDSNITLPPPYFWGKHSYLKPNHSLEYYLKRTKTQSLLILRNDTIVYQYYAPNLNADVELTSLSIAKGVLALLTGIAVHEGKLSLDDNISDWLLLWRDYPGYAPIKVKHLLQMTSGLGFREQYFNPFGGAARFYYGKNLRKKVLKIHPKYAPGTLYRYKSCDPILLTMILEQAVGKTVTEYLQEKLWTPCGMQYSGSWSLDGGDKPIEKSFCGINAKAEDFLRIGQVLLNQGKYNRQQLIPETWIQQLQQLDTSEASPRFYQYYWFQNPESTDYFAEGLNGQLIYLSPATKTVLVRFGSQIDWHWRYNLGYLAGSCNKKFPQKISPTHHKINGRYVFGISSAGDTSMVGKVAVFQIERNTLSLQTEVHKRFSAFPYSDNGFYDPKGKRDIQFYLDKNGEVEYLLWTRGRQSWKLFPQSLP